MKDVTAGELNTGLFPKLARVTDCAKFIMRWQLSTSTHLCRICDFDTLRMEAWQAFFFILYANALVTTFFNFAAERKTSS